MCYLSLCFILTHVFLFILIIYYLRYTKARLLLLCSDLVQSCLDCYVDDDLQITNVFVNFLYVSLFSSTFIALDFCEFGFNCRLFIIYLQKPNKLREMKLKCFLKQTSEKKIVFEI